MEEILISWLKCYTGVNITQNTKFTELNFDLFDEAVTVDFVFKNFTVNINKQEEWFDTVQDLIDAIAKCSNAHV